MSVRWSRIHADLGLAPVDLTYELVARAVDERLRESDDLDWKQSLPADVDKKLWDFAKDVAAMANTRGGVIVYGVRDEQEQAAGLTPVPTGERERQRLRAVLARYVRPLIAGVQIDSLNGESEDEGVIVLSVPASPDAPHVVGERNEMGVPFRHGPHTEWMSEYQIERAYKDRFTRRENETAALAAMFDEIGLQLDLNLGAWLVVASRPLTPLPALVTRPPKADVRPMLEGALRLAAQIYPHGGWRVKVLEVLDGNAVDNPRVGLRRWVVRANHYAEPGVLSNLIHIELHHDGAAVIAVALMRWAPEESFEDFVPVPKRVVEAALVDAVAVGAAHARSRQQTGRVLARTSLLSAASDKPFGAVDNYLGGGHYSNNLSLVQSSRAPRKVTSVEAEFAGDADADALRDIVRQLIEDFFHQFGIQDTSIPD